ncbi:MAG: hypothetical protein M1828_002951 [Chrysothrix sp. TS-e1954]|nr:MAG: hypothetical protein M1828_002951 [Chrysothrix sp. TS-e1954]
MASAPAVQAAQPAGFGTSLDPYLSTSSPFIGALLKPADNLNAGHLGHDGSQEKTSSRHGSQEDAIAAGRAASSHHARLQKKGSKLPKQPHTGNQPSKTSATYARTDTPPVISEEATDEPALPSGKTSKIKQNLRRSLHGPTQQQPDTTIDLSRTTEENEQLSGLTISSPTANSPSLNDTNFTRNIKNRQHARTYSTASANSGTSGSFKPTEPFVHPMRQAPGTSAYSTSFSQDFANKPISSTDANAFRATPKYSLSLSSSNDPYSASRPSLHVDTSSPSSQHNKQSPANNTSSRPRRNTNRSISSGLSSTASASDRAFSFIRGGTHSMPPVDAATRAASIHAARQAFNEREAVKQAKYDRKEQKRKHKEGQSAESRSESKTAPEPGIGQARAVTFLGDSSHSRKPKSPSARFWRWVKGALRT